MNVLVLMYKYYDEDPRPQREIHALLEAGHQVDVICPTQKGKKYDNHNRLKYFTVDMDRKRGHYLRYMFEYIYFFMYASVVSTYLHLRRNYGVIQVLVMPEFLILACIVPKLLGAKILMDWEDPMREVFLAKYNDKKSDYFLNLIDLLEKLSCVVADHIIIPNEGFRKAFSKRGIKNEKMTIVMNSPDERIFKQSNNNKKSHLTGDTFKILFSGSILRRHGLDIAIHALSEVIKRIENVKLIIVGSGKSTQECLSMVENLNLQAYVDYRGRVNLERIPSIIEESTLAIVPNRKNQFTMINFPQRILEYAVLKLPVIVPDLEGIRDYFGEDSVLFFKSESHIDLAQRIIELYLYPQKRQALSKNAFARSQSLSWQLQKKIYLNLIAQIT